MIIENLCVKRKIGNIAEATTKGHKIAIKGGYIHQTFQGGYTLSPLGYKVCAKIENIIRDEMNKLNGQEILMPIVSGADLWIESGRYDKVDVLAKFKGRNKADYVLNPTHEEVVVDFVKSVLETYKQLPFMVYQIQTKFRDELRARAGLIRTREFRMKDAYSFHETQSNLEEYYNKCLDAYHRIFKRIGLKNVVDVQSDNGDMGGNISHEFMLVHEIGEDTLYVCECGFRANKETLKDNDYICPKCQKELEKLRGIEIGNIFQLGDKYSKSMNLEYIANDGNIKNPIMGCYGIGVGRAFASILEESSDDFGPIFNMETAPFDVEIISIPDKEGNSFKHAQYLYDILKSENIDVLLDNRNVRAGEKFADADLISAPLRLIISQKNIDNGIAEIKYRVNNKDTTNYKKEIPLNNLITELKKILTLLH
jgi:prolyl-tRNA synthetase